MQEAVTGAAARALDARVARLARVRLGLSQADVAERMGTKAPAVTRLERALATGQHSPSIDTLRKYAAACGKKLVISFA
ncbi:helix-turn-helix transcriptional regulator [Burkholderia ambifaria]|uniref:helix-turn-helix domain-containing protein n=1 Tax=Burkholderia ambifaria TaxID=152480 RepID=UPI0022A95858|nr:helix-turn-helix transcriptional regulator [Burkholderia ambifaria]WAS56815.1 helix-turn-helix transcriptional regulator [Burkholderia ambifaria]